MPRAPPTPFYFISIVAVFVVFMIWTRSHEQPISALADIKSNGASTVTPDMISADSTSGDAIMGKLGNETAKAELGRAAWKLFHTTMARFPDKPTADESKALKDYIHLFARLYPCGECARHFQQILGRYPPQTSSRSSAAAWACFVHNEVNISKDKPVFDCANIGDWYDCGCAEDEKEDMKKHGAQSEKVVAGEPVEIVRDEPMDGG